MDDLPFGEEAFDLIWAAGSVYIMGFEAGIRYWRAFFREGGCLALTEATWFTETPSTEAKEF
jgi:hypothetical protein